MDLALDTRVLGNYTLSASVLTLADLTANPARKRPRNPRLPDSLLDRLACDQAVRGPSLGQDLRPAVLNRSLTPSAQIAAVAVAVKARDEAPAGFYRHHGFLPLQTQPRRLFVPPRRAAQLPG
ncbi:MAG: hypothetical protein ING39_08575 [Burkholderiales bacterium]|nr:hypothetical protein [Burkholderiales bacterium]